jgi:acid phosphatase type 7
MKTNLSYSAFKLKWQPTVIAITLMMVFATSAFAAAPLVETLTRGPYLQKLAPTSITIKWKTNIAAQSVVKYGTDSLSLSTTVSNLTLDTIHTITLTGLLPATRYYYSIGSSSTTLQGDGQNYFLTAPTVGSEGKYNFWLVGDCGTNTTNQFQVRDKYIAYMGNTPTNAWLLLGDNAYTAGTDAQYQAEFFNVYQNNIMKHAPLFPVPGNHDYNNGAVFNHSVPYYSIFDMPTNAEAGGVASGTKAYYSYDYGNVHFLSLDSYGKEDNVTRLFDTLGQEVTWIKQDLAANANKKFIVAYWHHPPYTMGSHNSDTESELVKIRTNFIRILERYGVDLIVCGHSHVYERSKLMKGNFGLETTFNAANHNTSLSNGRYDGTTGSCTYLKDSVKGYNGTIYVVAGSAGQVGGAQTSWPHDAMNAASNNTKGGSVLLTIEANRMDVKWICNDGVIRDQFTLIKDANKRKVQTIFAGQSVTLSASWPGQYSWNYNGATTRSITVSPSSTTTYVVQDQYQCVVDSFRVNVTPLSITTNLTLSSVCKGATVNIPFAVNSSFSNGNIFTAQLSDAAGSFAAPVDIGSLSSITSGTISATIPSNALIGTGYRIRVVANTPNCIGSNNGQDITINSLPIVGVSVSPSASVCPGLQVTLNGTGASSYTWSGGIINNTAFTPTATATYTLTGTANGCSNTATQTITVLSNYNITASAGSNGSITSSGVTQVCEGSAKTYTITPNSSYSITSVVVDGNNVGTNATYTFSNVIANHTISATFVAVLNCTSAPAKPGAIKGPTQVCTTPTASYSVAAVSGATSYTWTLRPGMINPVYNTAGNQVTVTLDGSVGIAMNGYLKVTASNACGTSAASQLLIYNTPAAPGSISGPTKLCGLSTATYSCAAITSATSYNWSFPSSITPSVVLNGSNTVTFTVPANTNITGTVSVTAENACGKGLPKNLLVNSTSAALSAISGPSTICVGLPFSYSVALLAGNNTYTWSTSATTLSISGNGTNVINLTAATNFGASGQVRVFANNGCANTTQVTKGIYKGACPVPVANNNNSGHTTSTYTSLDGSIHAKVYPNPVSTELNIEIETQKDMQAVVEMYDVLGNKVTENKVSLLQGVTLVSTSIADYSKGIYLLRMVDANGNMLFKTNVVKQ